jgi:hypothetical protein
MCVVGAITLSGRVFDLVAKGFALDLGLWEGACRLLVYAMDLECLL